MYDIPGVKEEWSDAVILAEENNIKDLATKIEKLVSDQSLNKEIGEKAYQRTLEYYTIKKCGEYIEKLLI